MKKKFLFMLTLVLLLSSFYMPGSTGGIFPVEVSAKASASLKKKAVRAYRNFVAGSDYTRFCVLDVDRDGLKELVVSYDMYFQGGDPTRLIIYKYRKGAVRRIGEDSTGFGYRYNKKTKRIHGLWGGYGSVQDWYLTTKKAGKLKRVYLSMIEERVVNGRQIFSYSYGGKKISRKAYFKKKRDWNKNYTALKMYKTSRKNINKYIK